MLAFSPHAVLGLLPGAAGDEVKAAYKKRALETHPDKGGDVEQFRQVRKAYEVLIKTSSGTCVGAATTSATTTTGTQAAKTTAPTSAAFQPSRMTASVFTSEFFTSAASSLGSQRLKRARSFEQELNAAFSVLPRASKSKATGPPVATRTRSSNIPAKPIAASESRRPVPPEHAVAATLWDKLQQLSQVDRDKAVQMLGEAAKKKLTNYLLFCKASRSNGQQPSVTSSNKEAAGLNCRKKASTAKLNSGAKKNSEIGLESKREFNR